MTIEKGWEAKTLEMLESDIWPDDFSFKSGLVTRVMELRKIPIGKFTTEDLRIMIGQQTGLLYLLPFAYKVLQDNIFAEGDFYEGDLLNAVLSTEQDFWRKNTSYWKQINQLLEIKVDKIKSHRPNINLEKFYSEKY